MGAARSRGGAALTDARLRQRARAPRGTGGGGGGGDGGGGHGLVVVGRRGAGGGGGAAEAAGGGAGGAGEAPVQPRPPSAPPSPRRHRAGAGGRVAAAEGAGGRSPVLVPQRAPGHRHRRHLLRAERHRARRRLRVFHPGGPVRVLRGGLVPAEPGAAAAPHDAAGAHGRRQRRRRRAARPALALRPLPLRRAPRGRDRPRGAPPRAPAAPREVTGLGGEPQGRRTLPKTVRKTAGSGETSPEPRNIAQAPKRHVNPKSPEIFPPKPAWIKPPAPPPAWDCLPHPAPTPRWGLVWCQNAPFWSLWIYFLALGGGGGGWLCPCSPSSPLQEAWALSGIPPEQLLLPKKPASAWLRCWVLC